IYMILFLIDKPKATLLPGTTTIPAGGSVTLTCSVDGSAEWKYYWSRQTSGSYEDLTMRYGDQNRELNISQGGKYWCTGGRGNPVFYTHAISNKVTLTLQPSWRQIFSGETITLRCEIEGGGDAEWEYEWRTPTSSTRWTYVNYWSISASPSYSGSYTCRGAHRGDQDSSTEWSKGITITVSRKSYISYSFISWCVNIQKGQTGVVSILFYLYNCMYEWETPRSLKPSDQHEYRISSASSSHSGDYRCRGRVKSAQQFSTKLSDSFSLTVSDNVRPSASLTVSPDRVQHFTSDSVSLSCEGNSTEWRVMRLPEGDYLSCSDWGRMTGSICNIHSLQYADAVYWCESGSGEFSNAVNMTADTGIILVSPVHPVAEGASVTLSCKLRPENVLSNVIFYKNDKLIQNDTRQELTIPAVSRSHEGFYKCKGETSLRTLRTVLHSFSYNKLNIANLSSLSSSVSTSIQRCCIHDSAT
uniref:Ig-like domain-containing protein n=1 Tax=Seriola lalandi dorsalis TaxID=1841481 RepID=A0A3B4YN66_SERLL